MVDLILRLTRRCFAALLLLPLASLAQGAPKVVQTPAPSGQSLVTVVEFADFECPYCARQAADLRKLQEEYNGKLLVIFKNFPLPFHSHARAAHMAALAALEQGKFWPMHDIIFSHPGHLSDVDFEHYASELGLDQDRFHRAIAAGFQTAIDADIAEGVKRGISGTPTFVIHGRIVEGLQSYGALKRIIDAELSGRSWSPQQTQSEGRVDVKTDGAPFLGAASAPITIVEFSDFQCPFCARAVPGIQRLIDSYRGNVRWVFKNFPLDSHADSELAHLAALAAGKQGKFWEMHDLIFAHQQTIKRQDLQNFASQLKLDLDRFQQDLESPELRAMIESDKSEGINLGVSGTPPFIINGQEVTGFSEARIRQEIARSAGRPFPEDQTAATVMVPKVDLSLGPADAQWKIEWYADLGSPLTARSAVKLQQFMAAHPGTVHVQFRNFPLLGRESSMLLHQFALAAAAQGKFWAVEALLLADPRPKGRNELRVLASQAGLDQVKLWTEVDAGIYAPVISRDLTHAREAGVMGTPTFVVGQKKLDGADGLQMLDRN